MTYPIICDIYRKSIWDTIHTSYMSDCYEKYSTWHVLPSHPSHNISRCHVLEKSSKRVKKWLFTFSQNVKKWTAVSQEMPLIEYFDSSEFSEPPDYSDEFEFSSPKHSESSKFFEPSEYSHVSEYSVSIKFFDLKFFFLPSKKFLLLLLIAGLAGGIESQKKK